VIFAPTCFGSRRSHHQGAVLCLAKTASVVFVVLVSIDVVNVMAAYQPVVQACGSRWRKELPSSIMNRMQVWITEFTHMAENHNFLVGKSITYFRGGNQT
jgi:hypothetical protein